MMDSKCCSFSFFFARVGCTTTWLAVSISCERSGPNPAVRPLPVGVSACLTLPLPAPQGGFPRFHVLAPPLSQGRLPGSTVAEPVGRTDRHTSVISWPSVNQKHPIGPLPPGRVWPAGLSRSYEPMDHSGALSRVRRDFKEFSSVSVSLNRMSFVGLPTGRQCP